MAVLTDYSRTMVTSISSEINYLKKGLLALLCHSLRSITSHNKASRHEVNSTTLCFYRRKRLAKNVTYLTSSY